MGSFNTEAIITGSKRFGEADRLLTLITLEKGKISAIAKSTRKPNSRLAGGTEPFTRGIYQLAEGKSLDIVRQVEVINPYFGIRENWKTSQLAGHVVEIINRMCEERMPDPAFYYILVDALEGLDSGEPCAVAYFKARVLDHMGVFPEMAGCARCGVERVRGQVHLDLAQYGFLCSDCASESQVFRPIKMEILYAMKALRQNEQIESGSETMISDAEDVLTDLLQGFLQRGFNTTRMAKMARKYEHRGPDKAP